MKYFVKLLSTIIFLNSIYSANLYAAKAAGLDPRVKVVLLTSAYGTVGGAVVGVAATGFGAKAKNIFIGASLGLYAGIGIGLFMVLSPRAKAYTPTPEDYDNIYNNKRGLLELNTLEKNKIALNMPDINYQNFILDKKNVDVYEANIIKVSF